MHMDPTRTRSRLFSPWSGFFGVLGVLCLFVQLKLLVNFNNEELCLQHHDSAKIEAHQGILDYIIAEKSRGYVPTRHNFPLSGVMGSYWWLNQSVPESFSFAQLDATYDTDYFDFGGHPDSANAVMVYTTFVANLSSLFLPNNRVTSLVEFGNGGGYFAKGFHELYGKHFITVEGTGAGVKTTLERYKVPQSQVVQHDLRLPLQLGRRFDVAVCSEVVEHVEPPFASQIVLTLILHADVIWFSFKPASVHHKAWINHPNERPFKFWKNLFAFYGYGVVQLPKSITEKSFYRGQLIAYNLGNKELQVPSTKDIEQAESEIDRVIAQAKN